MEEELYRIVKEHDFFNLESPQWLRFNLVHQPWESEAEFKITGKQILNTIGKVNGLYVYRMDNTILYIGKGNPIYGRVKSHYEENFKQPKGDSGLWHKFFSQHRGNVEVLWREVEDQGIQLFIEHAMTEHFNPKFINFKKEQKIKY